MTAIRLSRLEKHFRQGLLGRRNPVLRGLDLELPRGGRLGLVGPNGSGKSTLLRVLAGVERPSGGRVEVLGGAPVQEAVRRRVGWLPEDSPFPPELDARATLDLLGSLQGLARAERRRRGAALLERVGLADHARVPLGRYSRGMLRRFGLAQALLHGPELVLLDEPTAGLDAPGYGALHELLEEALAGGATLVLSSHLFGDVHEHCDRLAVLSGGRVALEGDPAEIGLGRGRLQLELTGVREGDLARIEAAVAPARVAARRPPQGLLLEIYRELQAGGEARP